LRILFLIPELGYGGAETALLRLASALSHRHTITLAVFNRTYQVPGYSTPDLEVPFPVEQLDRDTARPGIGGFGRLRRWWARAAGLWRLKQRHDITISFLGGANLLNAAVPSASPCVLSERGSKRFDSSRSPLQRWLWTRLLDPWAYRRADAIVTVSQGLQEEVRQALPRAQRAKVQAICGYADPQKALAAADAPIEPMLLALTQRPVLVAAGRLHHQKGFQHLLRVFSRVAPRVPGSALLLIGDGPLQASLIDQARGLGLRVSQPAIAEPMDPEAQLILLGYRPNPARYARLGRAFVLPSLYEGLPNLLLEALAAGAWCLAADCPWGPAEILTQPDLGELLPPIQDPRHQTLWENALLAALQRPDRIQLPLQRRRALIARFSIQRSADAWELLLAALTNQAASVDRCAA
jgi:glycosyltransferase involved in cell wall biosynthesis